MTEAGDEARAVGRRRQLASSGVCWVRSAAEGGEVAPDDRRIVHCEQRRLWRRWRLCEAEVGGGSRAEALVGLDVARGTRSRRDSGCCCVLYAWRRRASGAAFMCSRIVVRLAAVAGPAKSVSVEAAVGPVVSGAGSIFGSSRWKVSPVFFAERPVSMMYLRAVALLLCCVDTGGSSHQTKAIRHRLEALERTLDSELADEERGLFTSCDSTKDGSFADNTRSITADKFDACVGISLCSVCAPPAT